MKRIDLSKQEFISFNLPSKSFVQITNPIEMVDWGNGSFTVFSETDGYFIDCANDYWVSWRAGETEGVRNSPAIDSGLTLKTPMANADIPF